MNFSSFSHKLVILMLAAAMIACCGGSSKSDKPFDDNNSTTLPPNKIIVDGHILNPDFISSGKDYYVKLSYFNDEGVLLSHHDLYYWDGETLTFGQEWTYKYDAAGRIDAVDFEFTYTREAASGLYEHVFRTTDNEYDDNGNLLKVTELLMSADYDGDGVYDDAVNEVQDLTTHQYDDNGRLLETVIDCYGDGVADTSSDETIKFYYDDNDNVSRKEITIRADIDSPTTSVQVFTYDAFNRVATATQYNNLTNYQNEIKNLVTTYSYDEDGRLISEEIDSGVAHSSVQTLDGVPDDIVTYTYGVNGDIQEIVEEEISLSVTKKVTRMFVHETRDENDDGVPEVNATYVMWTDPVYDSGGGYPEEALPDWYVNAQSKINNGDDSDGWGLNWDGHDTGTCNTCGNMIGEVNKILLGF